MRDQPDVMFVVPLFGGLKRDAKLALGGRPIAQRHKTESARVTTLGAHGGFRFRQLYCAIEKFESRVAIALTSRNRSQRVQCVRFAFVVAFGTQRGGRAAEKALRGVEFPAQTRDFSP